MDPLIPKVLVVGGGPGGYVAAIRCGQLGLETVLVDAGGLGGTCLNRGCIPSKALIHAAGLHDRMVQAATSPRFGISLPAPPALDFEGLVAWKDGVVSKLHGGVSGLLRRAGVKVLDGRATFSDAKRCVVSTSAGNVLVTPEHVVLATGSVAAELPSLPFGGKVISSTEALSLPTVPGRLAVVGAGYIGLELGIAFRKLGSSVTIVEAMDRILPEYDAALTDPVRRWLARNGVEMLSGTRAVGESARGLLVRSGEGAEREIEADRILVAVGRVPATRGWGLEEMGIDMDGAFVRVDDRCRTSTRNVWAIGDLVGAPMLAHKASAQGELVAELIAGQKRRWAPAAIPAICYTEPEIVSVGIAPGGSDPADVVIKSVPFSANGRALTLGADDGGFVRVIAGAADGRLLGIQAVGADVSELVHQFTTLIEMGGVLDDVLGIVHAHPSLGEATREASLSALGRPMHA